MRKVIAVIISVLLTTLSFQIFPSSKADENLVITIFPYFVPCGNLSMPFHIYLEFHGSPNTEYKFGAWVYGGNESKEISKMWDDGWKGNYRYTKFSTNSDGEWSNWVHLKIIEDPDEGYNYYLKSKVKSVDGDDLAYDIVFHSSGEFNILTEGCYIEGYLGKDDEPLQGKVVIVGNGSKAIAIATTENDDIDEYSSNYGYYKVMVPEGENYTLSVVEKNGTEILSESNISVEKGETLNLDIGWHEPLPTTEIEREVLITEVYYDSYISYDTDEYVRIHNPNPESIDISGWEITDLEGSVIFPYKTILAPKTAIYITQNSSAFFWEMGIQPDFSYGELIIPNKALMLSNSGDEVILKDDLGEIIDVLVYGNSEYSGTGWSSVPVDGITEGGVLKRNIENGKYLDTNSSADWENLHTYRVGQSDFRYERFTFEGSVTLFTSPDSSFDVIVNELRNAKESIYLNIYEFTNLHIMDALLNAGERGVEIKVFLEGHPVGGLSDAERYIAEQIVDNGGEVRFMINDVENDIHDRYQYNHAKYCIIDNKTLIITSENWKNTGIPVNNTFGNRGWGIVLRYEPLADYFSNVFFEDFNPERKDSFQFNASHSTYGGPSDFVPDYDVPYGAYHPQFEPKTVNGTFTVSPVLSPDTSLLEDTVIGMIKSAKHSVLIEQLKCKKDWNDFPNLYLESAIDAARRGCEVKVLLDSRFNVSDPDNYETMVYINKIAEAENLNLEARMVYLRGLDKIHNKGVIVDNERVLISSINWNYNGVALNREVGVIVESKTVAEYFAEVFFYDWNLTPQNESNGVAHAVTTKGEFPILAFVITVILVIVTVAVLRDFLKRRK